jgi:hypothetical protein
MNKVILMGRLTRDPEVRYSAGENALAIARYTLAVDADSVVTERQVLILSAVFLSDVQQNLRRSISDRD